MESIELLQRLVDAVEKSGANIAPTYQEYMSMAFAIANSCGEQGRTYFHRLCRISEKYRPTDADKLYNNALKDGHRKNSLGSVWHLAEQAGVTIDMNLAILQSCNVPHTHPRARTREANSYSPRPVFASSPLPVKRFSSESMVFSGMPYRSACTSRS